MNNQFSLIILLKFLYNQSLTALLFCSLGSISREVYERKINDSKKAKNKKAKKIQPINVGAFVVTTLFSTILACAITDQIKVELHIAVYLLICFLLGLWGKTIMECLMNTKFLYNLCCNLVKSIASPIFKGAVEAFNKTVEDTNKEKEAKEKQLEDKEKENKEDKEKENKEEKEKE